MSNAHAILDQSLIHLVTKRDIAFQMGLGVKTLIIREEPIANTFAGAPKNLSFGIKDF